MFPIILFRFSWLILHWKTYTVYEVDQPILYTCFICMGLLYIPIFRLQNNLHGAMIYLINQMCLLSKTKQDLLGLKFCVNIPILGSKSSYEIFVTGFSSSFVLSPLAFFAAPFAIKYLPLQVFLGETFVVKFTEGLAYSLAMTHGSFNGLSVFLLSMVILEKTIHYSATTYLSKNQWQLNNYGYRFKEYYKKFRTTQIMFGIVNVVNLEFQVTLIYIGIVLASCCSYLTIKMYGKMPLITYLLMTVIASIGFLVALLQTFLEDIPYKHNKNFKTFWKLHLKRKEDCRMLRSCKPTGFSLGPYGVSTAKLGLLICDDIIRSTVNMVLLDVM